MNRLFTLLQTFLISAWNILRIPFPTTNIPIIALLFLPGIVSLALALFRNLFGIGGFAQLGSTQTSFNRAKDRGDMIDKRNGIF